MSNQLPQNKFIGSPTPPHRHGQAARVVEPLPRLAPAAPTWGGTANQVPLATVYRDGRVCLTAAARDQYAFGRCAELVPPSQAGMPWFLDLRPTATRLLSVNEPKSMWQFRCGYKLTRFFPHNSPRQSIELAAARWPVQLPDYVPLWLL